MDADNPAPNQTYYYLVRGVDGRSGETVPARTNFIGRPSPAGSMPTLAPQIPGR
jgi:hypothetical protein